MGASRSVRCRAHGVGVDAKDRPDRRILQPDGWRYGRSRSEHRDGIRLQFIQMGDSGSPPHPTSLTTTNPTSGNAARWCSAASPGGTVTLSISYTVRRARATSVGRGFTRVRTNKVTRSTNTITNRDRRRHESPDRERVRDAGFHAMRTTPADPRSTRMASPTNPLVQRKTAGVVGHYNYHRRMGH